MTLDFRNWPEIADIDDQGFREEMMVLKSASVIRGLITGLPELFHEEKQEFIFSRSAVVAEQVRYYLQEHGDEWDKQEAEASAKQHWYDACVNLGIPQLQFTRRPWREDYVPELFKEDRIYMPPELLVQMQATDFDICVGQCVMLSGIRMMIVDADSTESMVSLARADHIDLES